MEELTYDKEINKLRKRIKALEAQLISSQYFAMLSLAHLTEKKYMGSGIVLTITDLSGKEVMSPAMIKNGFSKETVNALKKDFEKSMKDTLELIGASFNKNIKE